MRKSESKGVSVAPQNIVRRLQRRVKRIEALYEEIEQLHDLLPVPTPEEFEEMERGQRPLSLEVLLLGVLGDCLFYLSEASATIDHYRPYTPRSVGKGTHAHWRSGLGDRIRREVKWRAKASQSSAASAE